MVRFVFWGNGSDEVKALVDAVRVRSTENFNWTFIFILAVVFYVYWTEIHKKNYEAVFAGLALYGVHWLYEIANAIIGHFAGYPLWSVSNESTTFILLIGVCWELSMMFSLAGIISQNKSANVLSTEILDILFQVVCFNTVVFQQFVSKGVQVFRRHRRKQVLNTQPKLSHRVAIHIEV